MSTSVISIIKNSVKTKKHLSFLHTKLKNLSKEFSSKLNNSVIRTSLILIKEAIYYKNGGYPKENSKPRVEELFSKFSSTVQGLKLLNREDFDLDLFLIKAGIKEIKFTDEIEESIRTLQKDTDLIKDLNDHVDSSLTLQKEICQSSDSVKINDFESLPPEFIKTKDNKYAWSRSSYVKLVSQESKKSTYIKNELESKLEKETFMILEELTFKNYINNN